MIKYAKIPQGGTLMSNEKKLQQRKERYETRRAEHTKRCEMCRKSPFPPSIERCEECTTGRKLRMLEVEYSDVTGWSHKIWNQDQAK